VVGDKSTIEWTDATWNPVTGCSKVSPGCAHCYAETLSLRRGWSRSAWTPENAAENVIFHPERMDQPLRWRKPRMVFVNSMSDLFHELVPDEFIQQVFDVMAQAQQHTFQVLTKRPERMRDFRRAWHRAHPECGSLRNVWLGTSIENRRFVHRADALRETPAAVRFISAEPLLGPLLHDAPHRRDATQHTEARARLGTCWADGYNGAELNLDGIDWLIVGGESGRGHRPVREEWVRDLRDAATTHPYETQFFFKQWGGNTPKAAGRLLDGRTWDEMPEVGR
jgi:protein gp37